MRKKVIALSTNAKKIVDVTPSIPMSRVHMLFDVYEGLAELEEIEDRAVNYDKHLAIKRNKFVEKCNGKIMLRKDRRKYYHPNKIATKTYLETVVKDNTKVYVFSNTSGVYVPPIVIGELETSRYAIQKLSSERLRKCFSYR